MNLLLQEISKRSNRARICHIKTGIESIKCKKAEEQFIRCCHIYLLKNHLGKLCINKTLLLRKKLLNFLSRKCLENAALY